jgi:hypothetical protein
VCVLPRGSVRLPDMIASQHIVPHALQLMLARKGQVDMQQDASGAWHLAHGVEVARLEGALQGGSVSLEGCRLLSPELLELCLRTSRGEALQAGALLFHLAKLQLRLCPTLLCAGGADLAGPGLLPSSISHGDLPAWLSHVALGAPGVAAPDISAALTQLCSLRPGGWLPVKNVVGHLRAVEFAAAGVEPSGNYTAASAASVLSRLGGGNRDVGASKLLLLDSWQASVMAAGGGPDKGLLSNRSTEDPEAWQDRILAAQPHIKAAFSEVLGRECLTQSGLIDEGAPAEALRQAQRGLLVQMRRRWCNCGEDRQSFIAPGSSLAVARAEGKSKRKGQQLVRLDGSLLLRVQPATAPAACLRFALFATCPVASLAAHRLAVPSNSDANCDLA